MKLCVLKIKLDTEPDFFDEDMGLYLYIQLPPQTYKLQILKDNVCTDAEKCATVCYKYAGSVLKKSRFEAGEEMISKSALVSRWYSKVILKGRFELGEESISKDGFNSYFYARGFLNGRFLLGEEAIKNSRFSKEYKLHFNIKL